MARKLRLEYPGAVYHVINRGNYRSWIFEEEGAKRAFVDCLLEACTRCEWTLHAYVVMGNHYHLAVETPKGNLSAGMQWLQSTFANRFNRFRDVRGHLFQGRFKAILVEDGDALGQVCHYIHLNPVRAKFVSVEGLKGYAFSTYPGLWQPKRRPACFTAETTLLHPLQAPDTPAGWEAYERYLQWQAEEGPLGKTKAYVSLSRGWALGSRDFKKALLKDHAIAEQTRGWDAHGQREVQQIRWAEALEKARSLLRRTDCTDTRQSAPWKVALAAYLKKTTDVKNEWLAEQLQMGSGFYVSKHVGLLRKSASTPAQALLTRLEVKGKA